MNAEAPLIDAGGTELNQLEIHGSPIANLGDGSVFNCADRTEVFQEYIYRDPTFHVFHNNLRGRRPTQRSMKNHPGLLRALYDRLGFPDMRGLKDEAGKSIEEIVETRVVRKLGNVYDGLKSAGRLVTGQAKKRKTHVHKTNQNPRLSAIPRSPSDSLTRTSEIPSNDPRTCILDAPGSPTYPLAPPTRLESPHDPPRPARSLRRTTRTIQNEGRRPTNFQTAFSALTSGDATRPLISLSPSSLPGPLQPMPVQPVSDVPPEKRSILSISGTYQSHSINATPETSRNTNRGASATNSRRRHEKHKGVNILGAFPALEDRDAEPNKCSSMPGLASSSIIDVVGAETEGDETVDIGRYAFEIDRELEQQKKRMAELNKQATLEAHTARKAASEILREKLRKARVERKVMEEEKEIAILETARQLEEMKIGNQRREEALALSRTPEYGASRARSIYETYSPSPSPRHTRSPYSDSPSQRSRLIPYPPSTEGSHPDQDSGYIKTRNRGQSRSQPRSRSRSRSMSIPPPDFTMTSAILDNNDRIRFPGEGDHNDEETVIVNRGSSHGVTREKHHYREGRTRWPTLGGDVINDDWTNADANGTAGVATDPASSPQSGYGRASSRRTVPLSPYHQSADDDDNREGGEYSDHYEGPRGLDAGSTAPILTSESMSEPEHEEDGEGFETVMSGKEKSQNQNQMYTRPSFNRLSSSSAKFDYANPHLASRPSPSSSHHNISSTPSPYTHNKRSSNSIPTPIRNLTSASASTFTTTTRSRSRSAVRSRSKSTHRSPATTNTTTSSLTPDTTYLLSLPIHQRLEHIQRVIVQSTAEAQDMARMEEEDRIRRRGGGSDSRR
ncbi:hypothetical protein BKA64DRAFT_766493 [Cadophora sp. MPI-SDFR-AT-0126]|nr:hypothetical protein BKA64DRAFT_766493 [Leotiomycetes sp. MPI-SDFR-AT-0126]